MKRTQARHNDSLHAVPNFWVPDMKRIAPYLLCLSASDHEVIIAFARHSDVYIPFHGKSLSA